METDPRAPRTLRHPEDTPTTFENIVRILRGPDKPYFAIPVLLSTDGTTHRLMADTRDYDTSGADGGATGVKKITFGDFEVFPDDLLYINPFRNGFSFVLIVYR